MFPSNSLQKVKVNYKALLHKEGFFFFKHIFTLILKIMARKFKKYRTEIIEYIIFYDVEY